MRAHHDRHHHHESGHEPTASETEPAAESPRAFEEEFGFTARKGPLTTPALVVIRGYQRWISPAMPPACRFQPTCSSYGYEAIAKYGILKGGRLAAWRIMRCNPFGGSGYDPVP